MFWQFGSEGQFATQSAHLVVDVPETNLVKLLEKEEFQERLVWGRQRGLALIFAAEAAPSDERSAFGSDIGLHHLPDHQGLWAGRRILCL